MGELNLDSLFSALLLNSLRRSYDLERVRIQYQHGGEWNDAALKMILTPVEAQDRFTTNQRPPVFIAINPDKSRLSALEFGKRQLRRQKKCKHYGTSQR